MDRKSALNEADRLLLEFIRTGDWEMNIAAGNDPGLVMLAGISARGKVADLLQQGMTFKEGDIRQVMIAAITGVKTQKPQ